MGVFAGNGLAIAADAISSKESTCAPPTTDAVAVNFRNKRRDNVSIRHPPHILDYLLTIKSIAPVHQAQHGAHLRYAMRVDIYPRDLLSS